MDQSKKTMRHFYCRDVLWETFEQMANDFDCSIDYLINEAMRFYARSKNYHAGPNPTLPPQGMPAVPAGNGPALSAPTMSGPAMSGPTMSAPTMSAPTMSAPND